jgi:hypothetical protein
MKLTAMLLLSILSIFLPDLITTRNTVASNPAPVLQDLKAPRGYSAVGRIVREKGDVLFLAKNPCTSTSRLFIVKFKEPFKKKRVVRPPCSNGLKVDFFYIEQQ